MTMLLEQVCDNELEQFLAHRKIALVECPLFFEPTQKAYSTAQRLGLSASACLSSDADVAILSPCDYLVGNSKRAFLDKAKVIDRRLKQKRTWFILSSPICSIEELWGWIRIIDPDGLGRNYKAFIERYVRKRARKELAERTKQFWFRRKASSERRIVIYEADEHEKIREAQREYISYVKIIHIFRTRGVRTARRLFKEKISDIKIKTLEDYISNHDCSGKVFYFSCSRLAKEAAKLKINIRRIRDVLQKDHEAVIVDPFAVKEAVRVEFAARSVTYLVLDGSYETKVMSNIIRSLEFLW